MDVEHPDVSEGETHPLLRQPKRVAVLAYLAAEGDEGLVARNELVEVFWSGSDEGRGRTALRQTLKYLRDHLPEGAVRRKGNSAVGLDPMVVGCDVLDFRALLADGRVAEALELYRGDLMDGFVVDAGEPFEAWLAARRESLRDRAAAEAWRLAKGAAEEDRPTEASFWGKRAVTLSGHDEEAFRRLMTLLGGAGDRSGALRAWEELTARLQAEGTEPDPLSRRIAREVEAMEPGEGTVPELGGGGRRSGVDRRSGEPRRERDLGRAAGERRSGTDRRSGDERRSGLDRREGG